MPTERESLEAILGPIGAKNPTLADSAWNAYRDAKDHNDFVSRLDAIAGLDNEYKSRMWDLRFSGVEAQKPAAPKSIPDTGGPMMKPPGRQTIGSSLSNLGHRMMDAVGL